MSPTIVLSDSEDDESFVQHVASPSKERRKPVIDDSEEEEELPEDQGGNGKQEKTSLPKKSTATFDVKDEGDLDLDDQGVLVWEPSPRKATPVLAEQSSNTLQERDINLLSSNPNKVFGKSSTSSTTSSKTPSLSGSTSKQKPSSTKNTLSKSKSFSNRKEDLAYELVKELNSSVFDNKFPSDFQVVWNKRLNTTAGRAHYRKSVDNKGNANIETRIELSTKVLDSEEKLNNTLSHEMCHVAVWLIDSVAPKEQPSHGPSFKSWAKKVMKQRPDLDITTCHNYDIEYKWQWRCTNESCGYIYRRHSKSIDPSKHRCGICKHMIELITDDPNRKQSPMKGKRTAYAEFVSREYARRKELDPFRERNEIMAEVREAWQKKKEQEQQKEHKTSKSTNDSTSKTFEDLFNKLHV